MANPPWGTFRDDYNRRSFNPHGFNTDKQVPQSLPAIANVAYHGATRVNDLESRIKVSEQSNRLLLEELMKLQQDLKLALRQNEEMVHKERQERIAVREKVEAAENMYNRVSMQLMRTEEKVNMEHNTLQTLLNQSKEVERSLAGGQQRSILKGEQTDRYISRFRDELSELKQMNEQIQSSLRLVGEDVKNLQHRFEMQNSEFESASQDMKQKVKRIETESIAAMENIQRNKTSRESMEGTSQLKQNIESRLSEIRDAVNEVRRKTDLEASERRAADQQADLSVEKVQAAVRDLETKYQEVSHAASLSMREKDNVHEVEKSKLTYKMAELTEETNKKALQREMQLREEAQMKFTILEKRYHEEQTSRLAFEKSVRHEMEKILDSVKMHLAEELQSMRQNAKLSKVHEDQSLVKMNQCITLLESEIEAGKKAFEEVLHAEIIARQTQNEETLLRCNELQEKLSVAVATLQQAISGVTSHTQEAVEQAKNEIFAVLDNSTNSGVKGLADIDSRLTNLNKHVAELEEAIESRPRPPSTSPNMEEVPVSNSEDYERLNRKVDRAHKWQEEAEKRLKDLNTKLHPIHGDISKLKGAIEDLENEMEARRLARLASLGDDNTPVAPAKPETPAEKETPVEKATPAHDPNLEKKVEKAEDDIVQISTQMEKLENTVNTLRTVLSQKISSEAKTVDQLREVLTGDIEKIVNYFLREQRHVFVKHRPTDARVYRPDVTKDGGTQAHSIHLALLGINRWGLYEAYRMLKIKQAWFDVVENKKNKTPTDENYINYDDKGKESDSEDEGKSEEKAEDKDSEKEESGKDDDDDEEKSEEKEDSDEEKESEEEEESEVEESEEEDEESEEESEEEDDEDEDDEKDSGSGEETEEESKKDKKPEKKPQAKPAAKPQAKPGGSTKPGSSGKKK